MIADSLLSQYGSFVSSYIFIGPPLLVCTNTTSESPVVFSSLVPTISCSYHPLVPDIYFDADVWRHIFVLAVKLIIAQYSIRRAGP